MGELADQAEACFGPVCAGGVPDGLRVRLDDQADPRVDAGGDQHLGDQAKRRKLIRRLAEGGEGGGGGIGLFPPENNFFDEPVSALFF